MPVRALPVGEVLPAPYGRPMGLVERWLKVALWLVAVVERAEVGGRGAVREKGAGEGTAGVTTPGRSEAVRSHSAVRSP